MPDYSATISNYNTSRNYTTTAEAPRQMQIPVQIDAQGKRIAVLTEHVTALEARLDGVLSRETNIGKENKPDPIESSSEIASKLHENNDAINDLSVRLSDMIRRLDL